MNDSTEGLGRALTRRAAVGALFMLGAAPAMAAQAQSRPYFLSGARVLTCDPDGGNLQTLVTGQNGGLNDGIAFHPASGRLFWTNMGRASADDGFIQSSKLDGSDLKMVVPPGGTFTPKQLKIVGDALYWSDREGMRVMRARLDGSAIETLVETGSGEADRREAKRWCVGIAVDPVRRQVYWTQKGGDDAGEGSIRRAGLDLPAGQTPATRKDIEVLFDRLPEPIDLDIEPTTRRLYWTDRGDNTISSAPLDPPRATDPAKRADRRIHVRGLKEAIGIALDPAADRMVYTSLGGEVGAARMDGRDARILLTGQRTATGIVLAP